MKAKGSGLLLALALTGALALAPSLATAEDKSVLTTKAAAGAIHVIHEPPTNPAHQGAFEAIRGEATFAKAREAFSMFRLPRDLTFKTRSCSGRGGAWYFEGTVTICYEYIQNIIESAASDKRPGWVSQEAAIRGPIADVVLHEGAHALFEFFRIPLLGREEDAADMVSTFGMLNLFRPQATALVHGVAYSYLVDARMRTFGDTPALEERVPLSRAYGGAHSTALQRLYSIVCHASGFDEAAFKELVELSELPAWRASGCVDEYRQIEHAFSTLLAPHIDRAKASALFPDAAFLNAP